LIRLNFGFANNILEFSLAFNLEMKKSFCVPKKQRQSRMALPLSETIFQAALLRQPISFVLLHSTNT